MDEYETQRERNAQNRGRLVGLLALFLTVNSFAAPVAMQISLQFLKSKISFIVTRKQNVTTGAISGAISIAVSVSRAPVKHS